MMLESSIVCLSIVWWLFTSYSFIDASTPEGYEEEEYYPEAEEEEEDCDQYPNQGKLHLIASYYCLQDYTNPKFYFTFCFNKDFLIVNFGLKY